jgi:glycerol-3-phosphate dehydrogenase
VLDLLQEDPTWVTRIAPALPSIRAEIVYCVRYEMAETMEDLLARRIGTQLFGWKEALQAAPMVAALLAREKGWDAERTERVLYEYQNKISGFLLQLGLEKD